MKKFIPLELSLAERLAAAQLVNPFCGFCRTEHAAVEELKGLLSAMMPGPAPAEPVGGPGKVHHPLHNIAEWRKGCSCATGHPSTCEECTEGLVQAIQRWFHQQVVSAQTQELASRVVDALLEDEKTEGFDLTAGMFGATFSALVAELANQQDTIKEMGELIDDLNQQLSDNGSAEGVVVDGSALRQLLDALSGPGHLIRELQVTRGLPGHTNPIDLLTEQLRAAR